MAINLVYIGIGSIQELCLGETNNIQFVHVYLSNSDGTIDGIINGE